MGNSFLVCVLIGHNCLVDTAYSHLRGVASVEEFPRLDWPVGMSGSYCLDCELIPEGQPTLGGTIPRQVVLDCIEHS